jgi:peptidoglycan/xylan/chitin deacetylase (PgdA/CDA1 family)
VLVYHRVAVLDRDPQRLAATPGNFADHMEFLVRHAAPMSLRDLVTRARAGGLPPGAVAITFDDGYADNLDGALPILEHHGVPATVFVTTGAVAAGREFWWDELEQVLLGPQVIAPDDAAWTVEQSRAPSPRHDRYRRLCHAWRTLEVSAREAGLRAIAEAGGARIEVRPSHRPLSADEVALLAASPLIDVGAHTISHTALAALTPEQQWAELHGARCQLEAWTGRPVSHLAYPFGGRGEVSRAVEQVARDAGFTVACTTQPGAVAATTNLYRVPRRIVRDWPIDEFARHWGQWAA